MNQRVNHVPKTGGPAFCALLLLSGFLLAGVTVQGATYVRGQMVPEVRLKNGKVYHGFAVVAVGSTSVVARWEGGQGSIPMAQLPDAMRVDLTPPPPKPVASAAAAPLTPAAPVDPKLASAELPTEIKLTNGFVMHKSTVKRWAEHSVLVNYQGGIVTVQFKYIIPEQRGIFEARKDEAMARQAKEDAYTSAGQEIIGRAEDAKQLQEAQAKEEAERLAEEITKGVSFHYLVKGMTKDDVKQAYGRPVDDHGDIFLYPSRGHDKYGNSADRALMFRDGRLIAWRDQREGEPDGAVDH